MNKKRILSMAAIPLAGLTGMLNAATPKEKPNIILFMVDDMGWQDTSVPFGPEKTPFNRIYETPNMERLARQGVKFTNAYACSISSPTRVSLLTGMNASRHRVTNWTLNYNQSVDGKSDVLKYPEWNLNGMSPTQGVEHTCVATPLPQLLKDNGYYTIHCGKAHFGAISTPAADPENLGFQVNIAGHAAGGLASYLGEENYGNKKDGTKSSPFAIPGLEKYHGTDVFVTEALTREAIHALDSRDPRKPFFLYMAHYAVHIPINKDKRYYQKYLDKGMDPIEAAYAGLIEGMDKSLGDLMNYLEENKLTDNTIIIFMSDNGGLSAAGTGRGGEANTHNLPLKSGKGSAYEGGIREPMIVSWPGTTKKESVCEDYLIIEDFYPTILEMAQVKRVKTVQPVDGKSFIPLLTGKGKNPSLNRALYWNTPNNWGPTGPGIAATCAIRQGDWKLIYYYETGAKELFNLKDDLGEATNLALTNPEKVNELSGKLGKFLRKSGGQRPSFKATGKPAPWPDETF